MAPNPYRYNDPADDWGAFQGPDRSIQSGYPVQALDASLLYSQNPNWVANQANWLVNHVSPRDVATFAIRMSPIGAISDMDWYSRQARLAQYEGRHGDAAWDTARSVVSALGLAPLALIGGSARAAPTVAGSAAAGLTRFLALDAANSLRGASAVGQGGLAAVGAPTPRALGGPDSSDEPGPVPVYPSDSHGLIWADPLLRHNPWDSRPAPDPAKVPQAPGAIDQLINFINTALDHR
jgi:hypothetical protein